MTLQSHRGLSLLNVLRSSEVRSNHLQLWTWRMWEQTLRRSTVSHHITLARDWTESQRDYLGNHLVMESLTSSESERRGSVL